MLEKSGKGVAEAKKMVTMESEMLHVLGNQVTDEHFESGYLATNQEFETSASASNTSGASLSSIPAPSASATTVSSTVSSVRIRSGPAAPSARSKRVT